MLAGSDDDEDALSEEEFDGEDRGGERAGLGAGGMGDARRALQIQIQIRLWDEGLKPGSRSVGGAMSCSLLGLRQAKSQSALTALFTPVVSASAAAYDG